MEKGISRLAMGVGTMPKAEVAVTPAGIGIGLGVLNEYLFSATMMMVVIVILVTPLLLRLVLSEQKGVVGDRGLIPVYVSDESRKVNLGLKRLGRR